MKITLCFIIFVGIYFFLSVDAQNLQRNSTRNPQVTRRQVPGRILVRRRNELQAQRIRRARKIVCFYSSSGRWPKYPVNLQRLVAAQSRKILGKSREEIIKFCRNLYFPTKPSITRRSNPNQVLTTRRFSTPRPFTISPNLPFFTTPRFLPTLPIFTTQSTTPGFFPTFTTPSTVFSTPSTTIFTTQTPSTTTRTFGLLPSNPVVQPITTQSTPSTTLSSVLRVVPVLTTPSTTTTTTTTVKPIASGSGSAYYSGSGSAYYSGSGSAYYSATGSLTAKDTDRSGKLTRPANELTRSFKAKNGDIIIKWTPGGGKLKKIGV